MKNITQALKVIALALTLSFGISYVYAWTAPTVTPPGGNVSAPINTSATAQYKEGALGIGGLLRGYANAIFDGSVGVGITTPQAPLHTAGSINAPSNSATPNGSIMIGGTGTGVQMSMGVTADVAPQYGWIQPRYTNNNTNYNLALNPNGGSVGIGVSNPTQKLDVAGNIKGTGLCIGTDCKTSWPTGGVTPPAGSEFLDTSATAQTKAGAITTNGLTTTNRLTVGEAGGAYSFVTLKDDESPNGVKYVHANSNVVGFLSGYGGWLSYWDNAGNQQNSGAITAASLNTGGTVTAAGNIQGQHIKFPGVGGDSGAGADVYSIYQESGPWSYPYPDLRIQYHTGIKYDAYQGYGGHQFYTGWDGSGNPAGLQMQITDKVYVSNDVCTTAGKCLSATGGGPDSGTICGWYALNFNLVSNQWGTTYSPCKGYNPGSSCPPGYTQRASWSFGYSHYNSMWCSKD